MDSRLYPQGSRTLKSKYEDGVLVFRNPAGEEIWRVDPATRTVTYAEGSTLSFDDESLTVTTPDDSTLELNGQDKLSIKDGGVTLEKLASAVTDILDDFEARIADLEAVEDNLS